jgi:hypothetical protein
MSYNIPGSGETVGRQSGTAEYTVSSFSPAEIVLAEHAHFDGGLDDNGKVVIKDHGRTICYKGNCSPATDASGVLYNPLMWGDVPNTIRVGMQWEVPIGLAWEFGPPGKQTVTVIALDPKNHAVTLKREDFGDGPHADDPKTVSLRKDGKVVVARVMPGKTHWIGLTVFQSGIVVSDELLMERPVTYQSDQIGKVTGSEREYMLRSNLTETHRLSAECNQFCHPVHVILPPGVRRNAPYHPRRRRAAC